MPGEGRTTGPLTPAQKRVGKLLTEGHNNESISHQLGITQDTVKVHMHCIMRKLGATNRTEAAIKLLKQNTGV